MTLVGERLAARRAGTADLAALTALESACFEADERWSSASWRAELDGSDRAVWVATRARRARADDGGCQAFDEAVAACCAHRCGDDAELFRVATAPGYRGLGVATMLVSAAMAWAGAAGATRMLLEVRHDNARARSLYADLGFTDLYLRTNYYAFGQDAVVMSRPLTNVQPAAPTIIAPWQPETTSVRNGLWADLHDHEGESDD
jgi:ribosomal protein S18 acetylase RimI-like enzyme